MLGRPAVEQQAQVRVLVLGLNTRLRENHSCGQFPLHYDKSTHLNRVEGAFTESLVERVLGFAVLAAEEEGGHVEAARQLPGVLGLVPSEQLAEGAVQVGVRRGKVGASLLKHCLQLLLVSLVLVDIKTEE